MTRAQLNRRILAAALLLPLIWLGPLLGYQSFGVLWICAISTMFLAIDLVLNIRKLRLAD